MPGSDSVGVTQGTIVTPIGLKDMKKTNTRDIMIMEDLTIFKVTAVS